MARTSVPAAHAERNLGRPVQLSQRCEGDSAATKASKALKKSERKAKREQLEDELDNWFGHRDSEIMRVALALSMKPLAVRKLFCNTLRLKTRRAPSLRNAIIHDRVLAAKRAGEHPKALLDLQDELADAIEEGEAVLIAHRTLQRVGMHATNKASSMDVQQTVRAIGSMLLDLFERTGTRGFCVVSRGHANEPGLPAMVDSDDSMSAFFKQVYKVSELHVLRSFEQFSCTQDNASKQKNDLTSLRKQIVEINTEGLRHAGTDKKATMLYDHYDYEVRELKRAEIVGWPKDIVFQRPSKMSADEARTIRNAFKTGAIFWRRISNADHAALVEARKHSGEPAKKVRRDKGGTHAKKSAHKGKKSAECSEEDEDEEEDEEDEEQVVSAVTRTMRTTAAPLPTAAAEPTPIALHLADTSGDMLNAADMSGDVQNSTAAGPTFDFGDLNFDLMAPIIYSTMPTMDMGEFGDTFGDTAGFTAAPAPAAPSSATATAPASFTTATVTSSTFVPPFGNATTASVNPPAATVGSTSVFALQTNTVGGEKRKRKAQSEDTAEPTATKRKKRSDAGKPRGQNKDSADPSAASGRKKRSDAGKPRKSKAKEGAVGA
ncbi:hypothetical protein B0H17DRAFT_1197005 [Mycena rosella]|uniref:Uncharacterized protein n=1 Tax=Mycena rosella TaxID=1033263 RepID=A0AAD7DRF4_MYCRO|nr:hypothetical protein B0H17DRAFT_1197005 [Mycena rosella]